MPANDVNIADTPGLWGLLRRPTVPIWRLMLPSHGCWLSQGIRGPNQKLSRLSNTVGPVFTFMNKLDRDGRRHLTSWKSWCLVLPVTQWTGLSVWVKLSKDFTTFITNAWSFTKVMKPLPRLKMSDTLFANNPFYEQAKEDIELLTEAGNGVQAI